MKTATERMQDAQEAERIQALRVRPEDITLEPQHKTVEVWVCPTPGCGDYYGSSTAGDLTKQHSGPKVEDRAKLKEETGSPWKHNRAECPSCRQRGQKIQRQRVRVKIELPAMKMVDTFSGPLPDGYSADEIPVSGVTPA